MMSKSNFFFLERFSLFVLSWLQTNTALLSLTSLIALLIATPTKVSAVGTQINLITQDESPVSGKAPTKVKLSAPQVYVPPVSTSQGKNSFLDTNSYTSPKSTQTPTVVIQSRQSGCQTVINQGRINGCGGVSASKPTSKVTISRHNTPPASLKQKSHYSRSTQHRPSYVATRGDNLASYQTPQPQPRIYTHANRAKAVIPGDSKTALMFPLSIPARISSTFGWRVHPVTGSRRMHYGTDLAAAMGTPVLAAYSGQAAIADNLGGYGLTVILRHLDNTQESRYAHLSEIFVQAGEWVEQGAVIGLVGSSGLSTGPHLHFEWRHNTTQGWVATDAGLHLEYALDNLIKSMALANNQEKLTMNN
jgi:murein DD-endopeptidase MepM/ murein hydrolase activator NlpD